VSEPSRVLRVAAVPVMLLAGGLVAIQSQINGRVSTGLGTGSRAGFAAAIVSFGTGLVLVGMITAILPAGRTGFRRLVQSVRTGHLRWTEFLGGAFGAFLVATQGLTVGMIGVALFSIAVTAGQSASALLVDHFGLGPSGHQPLSIPRLVAAAFAVIAVTVVWTTMFAVYVRRERIPVFDLSALSPPPGTPAGPATAAATGPDQAAQPPQHGSGPEER